MRYLKKLIFIVLTGTALFLAGCMDLAVDNLNEPSTGEVMENPEDLEGFMGGMYYHFWNGTQKYYPAMTTSTMANERSSSWGNFGMNDLSSFPRASFVNDPSYADINMAATPWSNLYNAISSVNDVLREVYENPEMFSEFTPDRINRMEAFSRFIQAISYGHLANYFDQGFVVDWDTEVLADDGTAIFPPPFDFQPYQDLHDFAMAQFEEAINIAESSDFTLPSGWIRGNELHSSEFAVLIKAYQVRKMVGFARTTEDRENLDWQAIADLAEDILDSGFLQELPDQAFAVNADGEQWWSGPHSLGSDPTWSRAYYEFIGKYDQSGQFEDWISGPYEDRNEFDLVTPDARIAGQDGEGAMSTAPGTDFQHVGGSAFDPSRGLYHFSRYLHTRNSEMYPAYVGPMHHFRLGEISMYRAEALLRLNDPIVLPEVAELINETRVERGGLDPITVLDDWQTVFNAMRYEFEIETFNTAGQLSYFYRRSIGDTYETSDGFQWGGIVEGTPLHFPVPAEELDLLDIPYYTHGGSEGDAAPKTNNSVLYNALFGQQRDVQKQ